MLGYVLSAPCLLLLADRYPLLLAASCTLLLPARCPVHLACRARCALAVPADRFVASLADDGTCLIWRHWNEVGERELSETDSEAEEERAQARRSLCLVCSNNIWSDAPPTEQSDGWV